MHTHSFNDVEQAYNFLYFFRKNILLNKDFTFDKASRKSNIYAVKNCWKLFNKKYEK